MIVLSNSETLTVPVGGSLTFDTERLRTGCAECHRAGTGSVRMKRRGAYDVEFTGNISSATTGEVRLIMKIGDDVLPETEIISNVYGPNNYSNVSAKTGVYVGCCDYSRVSVVNEGTTPVLIAPNSSFIVGWRCS